jgi:hypothetical protein
MLLSRSNFRSNPLCLHGVPVFESLKLTPFLIFTVSLQIVHVVSRIATRKTMAPVSSPFLSFIYGLTHFEMFH